MNGPDPRDPMSLIAVVIGGDHCEGAQLAAAALLSMDGHLTYGLDAGDVAGILRELATAGWLAVSPGGGTAFVTRPLFDKDGRVCGRVRLSVNELRELRTLLIERLTAGQEE